MVTLSSAYGPCRRFTLLAAGFMLAILLIASDAHAQAILALVNGDPITAFDVDQRIKLIKLADRKVVTQKEALEILIDDRLKIKEGQRFKVDLTPSEVDEQYEGMAKRMKMTPEQLGKVLEGQGVRPQTLKNRIRSDFIWSQLVRGRFQQSLIVGEKEIRAALNQQDTKSSDNSFEYSLRPIVLLVTGSSESSSIDTRRKEAEALRARIQTCDQASEIFRSLRDAVIRDTVTKTSADIPPSLRTILDTTPVGHLTAPEVTKQGVEMVALCDRKPTTLDTPQKRETRDKLFARKYEAQSKKYLDSIRRASMIEYR